MKRLSIWLSVLCLLTLLVSPAFGQGKTTGTISGTVVDPQNAVVPNAQVTISDPGTGLTRTVTADSNGYFAATELPAATYTVTVAQSGFKQYKATGVVLHISSTVTLPIQLQVGEKTEVVNVEATDIQVQTDSAQLGEVVNGQQVRELPLNGRSFVQLTQLQPGVSGANNFDSKNKGLLAGVDFSVNGNPNTNNLFLVDGANNNDVGSNRTILIYPSIEAIAEFKMLRNSYGAEYGQASGAVINIATRSGSNQFHGSVLYYGRNDALNSYEYFAAQNAAAQKLQTGTATPKDKLRRNDYGYSIGGPIIKDKLFFFFNQEWNKEIRGATRSSCVPTAAEKLGDFSQDFAQNADGNWVDQCNGPRPNIPAAFQTAGNPYKFSSIDPSAALWVSQLPDPNLATPVNGNNWILSVPSKINWSQYNVRVDYNLNSANTIMGRYTKDNWENPAPNYQPGGLWGDDAFPSIEGSWKQPSKQAVMKLTSTIGGTFVNDVSFTYSANDIIITEGGTNAQLQDQISGAIPLMFPESFKTVHSRLPVVWGGFGAYAAGNLWSIAPWTNNLGIYTIRDDASKVMGNHTFKAGVFFGWDGKNEDAGNSGSESITFGTADWGTNMGTSNQLANVLVPSATNLAAWVADQALPEDQRTGVVPNGAIWNNMGEKSTNTRVKLRWHDYEGYVADTWKARRNLTLDMGVRYSWLPYPHSPNNAFSNFIPSLYNPTVGSADPCNGMWIVAGTNSCSNANAKFNTNVFGAGTVGPNNTLVYNSKKLFAPRLGIAWDPWGDGNTSVRAGFGMFYQRERISTSYVNEDNSPFAVTVTVPRTFDTAGNLVGATASPAGGRDPKDVVPTSYQWNLSVERGFAKNTTLSLGYVGNRGVHLTNDYDLNQVIPGGIVPTVDLSHDFGGGNNIHYVTHNVPTQVASIFTSGGTENAFRPYANWGSLNYWAHNGDATYHSLQAMFKTRYKRSELQAAYTWSHSIADVQLDNSSGGLGNQSYTDPTNPGLDKGNSAINRPHIFVANAIFNLPELKDRSGIVRNVLGGWELGVIQTAASGNSFTIYQNGISSGDGFGWVGEIQGTGYTNYQRPLIVAGQKCQGDGSQIINPAAFSLIGYDLGNLANNPATEKRGWCAGPHMINTDLSINKNWQVPFIQNEKMRIQFRLDMFNAFNHAQFRPDQLQQFSPVNQITGCTGGDNSVYNVGVPAAFQLGPSVCTPVNHIVSSTSAQSGFGYSNRTRGGREIQYGLKLTF